VDKTVAAPDNVTGPVSVASPNPRIAPPPATPEPAIVNGSAANSKPAPISNAAPDSTVVPAVTAPSAEADAMRKAPSATVIVPVNVFTPPNTNVPASRFVTPAAPLTTPSHRATRPDETRKSTPHADSTANAFVVVKSAVSPKDATPDPDPNATDPLPIAASESTKTDPLIANPPVNRFAPESVTACDPSTTTPALPRTDAEIVDPLTPPPTIRPRLVPKSNTVVETVDPEFNTNAACSPAVTPSVNGPSTVVAFSCNALNETPAVNVFNVVVVAMNGFPAGTRLMSVPTVKHTTSEPDNPTMFNVGSTGDVCAKIHGITPPDINPVVSVTVTRSRVDNPPSGPVVDTNVSIPPVCRNTPNVSRVLSAAAVASTATTEGAATRNSGTTVFVSVPAIPVTCNVPPFISTFPVPNGDPCACANPSSLPASTTVPPTYVFAFVSVNTPLPTFVNATFPCTNPPYTELPSPLPAVNRLSTVAEFDTNPAPNGLVNTDVNPVAPEDNAPIV
jgi:hypothetical protein